MAQARTKPGEKADHAAGARGIEAGRLAALDPANTLYMELPGGRVVIELATAFAPLHAANIRTLVRQKYFDGLAILRVQDNFVTQWGDPDADDEQQGAVLGRCQRTLPQNSAVPRRDLAFTRLPDGDVYAPEVGFSNGFPAARDPKSGQAWLAHCYGMVGAGRGNEAESGSGAELYVVIGHAPRQLDRNIATVGRVVRGMELLAALPRGSGPAGFYEKRRADAADPLCPAGRRCCSPQTQRSRSPAHRHADLHRAGRVAPQSQRRLVPEPGRKDRSVQRALTCTRAQADHRKRP